MNVTVMDKFVKGGNFGFVFQLQVPSDFTYYSILIEYPQGVFGANFQTWNLNYFGFYEQYVMLHAKPTTQAIKGDDRFQHSLVMENVEIDALRAYLNY